MTERELETRMRDWYRARVEGVSAPNELRLSVLAVPNDVPAPGVSPFARRRGMLLLAAALLVTLVIGSAIAIGAGLLRLPWLPQRVDPVIELSGEFLGPLPCDETLPPPLVLAVEVFHPGDERTADRTETVFVYRDGSVLHLEDDVDEAPSHRQLTEAGVEALQEMMAASGLDGCIEVPVEGPSLRVVARTGNGIASAHLGSGGGIRITTNAELEAAATLANRLRRTDLGLPASAWAMYEAEPYEREQWEVWVRRSDSSFGDQGLVVHQGHWQDLVLPDGSTFLTVGTPLAPDATDGYLEVRCAVVANDQVDDWLAFLGEPAEIGENLWLYQDRDDAVSVSVHGLLPHQPPCGPSDHRYAEPESSAEMLEDVRVCDYLPEASFGEGWEIAQHNRAWSSCEYLSFGWVYESRYPLAEDQARRVIANQFGPNAFTTERIRGRTVYFSACAQDAACHPAAAILAEPYLVIVVPDWTLRSGWLPLVDRVITSAEALDGGDTAS